MRLGRWVMSEVWKQERPLWCPHQSCIFKRRAMDSMCGGVLPEPQPHAGDENTYRLCLRQDSTGSDHGQIDDYQMNKSDFWWLRLVMEGVERDD